MATLEDVLHHLVAHTPGLSDENRQEFHDAITPPEDDDEDEEPSPRAKK